MTLTCFHLMITLEAQSLTLKTDSCLALELAVGSPNPTASKSGPNQGQGQREGWRSEPTAPFQEACILSWGSRARICLPHSHHWSSCS